MSADFDLGFPRFDDAWNTGKTDRDFPLGTRVRIMCDGRDFVCFLAGQETGTVIDNTGGYLGIMVRLDRPHRERHDRQRVFVREQHNFQPIDLLPLDDEEAVHNGR